MIRDVAVAALCGAAVLLTLGCALGVAVMRDPWQQLHFVAPPSTLGAALLALAVGLAAGPRAAVKPAIVLLVLAALNGVVTHALARAAWVRRHREWPPEREERDA